MKNKIFFAQKNGTGDSAEPKLSVNVLARGKNPWVRIPKFNRFLHKKMGPEGFEPTTKGL